jgi:Xaa-Pro dipeptidase
MHLAHQKKLLNELDRQKGHFVFMEGAKVSHRYGTDYEYAFRQESNFWYLTGVDEPDFLFMLDLYDGQSYLFIPKRDSHYAVWHGKVTPMQEYLETLQPDNIYYTDEIGKVFSNLEVSVVHTLNESAALNLLPINEHHELVTEHLEPAIARCRVIKSEYEIEQLGLACKANDRAYVQLMKKIKPGDWEYTAQAIHAAENIDQGLLHAAYSGIFAGGTNAAILHYTLNNEQLRDGDLLLVDAGYECNGYASDYTRTFPVNGKFSTRQKAIYDIVLAAQNKAIELLKPGTLTEDLHYAAARVITEGLLDLGLLKGSVEDLMKEHVFALFFPHGLGHMIGLDTHDPGGYLPNEERIDKPGIKFLRMRRTLEEGMAITIEPGIYFVQALLDEAFKNPDYDVFLNKDLIKTYLDFGGVRIEDNCVITKDGCINLTNVPKETADIEALMNS